MKHDGLVSRQILEGVEAEVRGAEKCEVMQRLRHVEPDLYDRIVLGIRGAVDSLEEQGVECDAAGAADAVLWTALVCVQSLRRAHWELWRDCFAGTRLGLLDPTMGRPPTSPGDAQGAGEPGSPGAADAGATDENADSPNPEPPGDVEP